MSSLLNSRQEPESCFSVVVLENIRLFNDNLIVIL